MNDSVRKKVVAVTGASRGIGRAAAVEFASRGYGVAINCKKNKAALFKLRDELIGRGVKCAAYVGDMGVFENARSFFEIIKKEFGRIDVLVNNAGVSYVGLLQDMTADEWDGVIRSNLTSAFNCSKPAVEMMLKKKEGKIINVSSVWGCAGASMEVAYSAAKGGLNAFTRALARELAPSNIQVNAIAFGMIDTDMNKFLDEDELNYIKGEIPAQRVGSPGEAADFICRIAEAGSYLTGQVIRFDGGWI